ncbi:MAG: hypothetical protein U9Q23_01740 [Candidatus Bipolaricaulota bacterium]|nr:hypothetical protein [Candidatus Bipolaricaulota bacterium]
MLHSPIGGVITALIISAVGIGLAIIISAYVIGPLTTPEKRGTVTYQDDYFRLHYKRGSSARAEHRTLALALKQELDGLVQLLQVDLNLLPAPIDVFVHDDIMAMQTSIRLRKSPLSSTVYSAPIDLLAGEDPRGRLAELVLAFGWGECGSQILQTGIRLYAAEPGRNFHAIVAALPDRMFLSLPELIRLEEIGRFPRSLYQRFDSPYSPAMVGSFVDLSHMRVEISPADIALLEAASFVQFLIEKCGMQALKGAWEAGIAGQLPEQLSLNSIAQLGSTWRGVAVNQGKDSPDFPYLCAYYLLKNGDPDAAYERTSSWAVPSLSEQESLLAARCALTVGAITDVDQLVQHLSNREKRDEFKWMLPQFDEWGEMTDPRLRIFAPVGSLQRLLSIAEETYNSIVKRLDLSSDSLPERITLFVYPDEAARARGALLLPDSATLQLVEDDDLGYRLCEFIPTYAWGKNTYSKLLWAGLAVALSRDEELLAEQGRQLRCTEEWVPLSSIDFGVAEQETVEVEAGLLLHYLLETFGPQTVRSIWTATSSLDRYLSVDTALQEICGTTRDEIEKALFSSILRCN